MILAGLQTVPTTITDAATIDGANSFQRFFIIILPFIKHILILAALLSTVRLFQDITLIFILTSGGPVYSTTTLAIHVYKLAFDSFQMGKAASIGVTWLILLFFLAIFYVRMVTQSEFRK
jgi:multiple sugar transport system permease protein